MPQLYPATAQRDAGAGGCDIDRCRRRAGGQRVRHREARGDHLRGLAFHHLGAALHEAPGGVGDRACRQPPYGPWAAGDGTRAGARQGAAQRCRHDRGAAQSDASARRGGMPSGYRRRSPVAPKPGVADGDRLHGAGHRCRSVGQPQAARGQDTFPAQHDMSRRGLPHPARSPEPGGERPVGRRRRGTAARPRHSVSVPHRQCRQRPAALRPHPLRLGGRERPSAQSPHAAGRRHHASGTRLHQTVHHTRSLQRLHTQRQPPADAAAVAPDSGDPQPHLAAGLPARQPQRLRRTQRRPADTGV